MTMGRARCAKARGSARRRWAARSTATTSRSWRRWRSSELIEVVRAITDPVAAPMVAVAARAPAAHGRHRPRIPEPQPRDRYASGGESQRIKMVKHLSSSLVDVMYIFDEPSVGLHPRDVHRLNELLQKLRDKGNTVLVVEHDPDVIKVADHVVDVGPHAGQRGGDDRLRGQLRGPAPGRHAHRPPPEAGHADQAKLSAPAKGQLRISQRQRQQPAERQRRYPDGRADGHHRRRRLGQKLADQPGLPAPASRRDRRSTSRRSASTAAPTRPPTPASWTTCARPSPLPTRSAPSLFSFNSKGACENCQGLGRHLHRPGVPGRA